MKKNLNIIVPILLIAILISVVYVYQTNSQETGKNQDTFQESSQVSKFRGEKGEFVSLKDRKVTLSSDLFSDGKVHYFNTTLPNGNPIYFFVIKSPDGNIRAAANGCQVCGEALQGFRQEGTYMVCNTCGNRYPLSKIATEKGGCNPAPINPNLRVQDGEVSIKLPELQSVEQYF